MAYRGKKELNIIDPELLQAQVEACINDYCIKYNLDISNYNFRVNIKHNEVNNILRFCYNSIFRPDKKLFNNQKSLIDYDNLDQLSAVAESFINICSLFNKSLGLYSFSIFSGIDYKTIYNWISAEGEKISPARFQILQNIKEYNKAALVSILKDSPVGALAVANNDVETGLQWSAAQAQQITQNTIYLLPSERLDRLKLEKLSD